MGEGFAQFWQDTRVDSTGAPLASGKLYAYEAGTVTPKTIWSDAAKTTPISQPLIADANGYFAFYGDGDYKIKITDSVDAEITGSPWDNVQITADKATLWEGNVGLATPAAASQNLYQLYAVIDGSGNFVDLKINHNTATPIFVSVIDEYLSNNFVTDLLTKQPWTNIRAFGADPASADNSTEIQAAIDYIDGLGGGILFIPPGTFKCKNLNLVDNMVIQGSGHSSVLKFPASISNGDYIFKLTNKQNLDLRDVWFDGSGLGQYSRLLWITNNTGTHTHLRIENCHFENLAATGKAVIYEGDVTNDISVGTMSNCHTHDVDVGIRINYADGFNMSNNFFDNTSASPISIANSSRCSLVDNYFEDWASTKAAIVLVDTDESQILGNNVVGTEDYSIQTTGTSNYNRIMSNNVRGGHTNDIVSAGTNDIVIHNIGSAVQKGGQGEATGDASATDWDYVKYTGTTITDPFAAAGQIYDSTIIFPDTALSIADPPSGYDNIRLPNLTNDENMYFSVRDIVTTNNDNTLKLGNSNVLDSAVSISAGETYSGYPNFTDTPPTDIWDWESVVFYEDTIAVTSVEQSKTKTLIGEQELFRVEVWGNSGSPSNWVTVRMQCTGVSKKDIMYQTLTNGTTILAKAYIYKPSGSHTFTWYAISNATSSVRLKIYRLKRTVDL